MRRCGRIHVVSNRIGQGDKQRASSVSIQFENEWLERTKMSLFEAPPRRDSKGGRLRDKNGKFRKGQSTFRSTTTSTGSLILSHTRANTHTLSQWLYVVGSTNDGTSCRVLKLSCSPPSNSDPKLVVEEVGMEYTEKEIKDLLIMLDGGNKCSANKYKQHGLKQVASAFGIIGFIRFLEGYYIVLITKRKP